MTNFTLKFGKFKGMNFNATPVWYQEWLVKQDWFKMPANNIDSDRMPRISPSWDGYSRRGEAQQWAVFEWEKRQAEKLDCMYGICSCCEDSKYYGM
jgi:hypothetical protein